MPGIMDIVTQSLGNEELRNISRQIGADERTTASALETSLPVLLGALNRNASQGDGAQQIFNAVERDHDGSLFDNLNDFIGHAEQGPGDGILNHMLGARRPAVENGIGKATGLNTGSIGKLLTILAPMVMGAIGQSRRSRSLQDSNGLNDMLRRETQTFERQNPRGNSALAMLLDTDNDGDVDITDLAKHGLGLLSKFLR